MEQYEVFDLGSVAMANRTLYFVNQRGFNICIGYSQRWKTCWPGHKSQSDLS